ncbi:E3 ubiquitin-protein ligase TRIM68-like isoform X2 [Protopterus annectens]|uniref:E3 ubiquitin-protein ligase TRIM68-like isoform X2 n=1 Tax=Protopterus annectens TaxID=7888 RepID=UPI001CFC4038|nr:E3 ubiquitin-protein ligase TRIM68-like isoform X2 [Protopterus annectens]
MTDEEELSYSANLICPSCRKIYNLPLFLPCSHSLCQACILSVRKLSIQKAYHNSYSQSSLSIVTIDCPICWLPIELPCPDWDTVLEYLPVNWTLKSILDCYTLHATCNDHGKRWRLFFCERTGTFVCRACRPNLLEDDSIITLEDAWAARKDFVINTLLSMKDGDGNLSEQTRKKAAAEISVQDEAHGQHSSMLRHCSQEASDNPRMSRDHLGPKTLKCGTDTTNITLTGILVQKKDLRLMFEEALQENDLIRLLEVARLCSMECTPMPDNYAHSGLTFRLDPSTADPLLSISCSGLQMTYSAEPDLIPLLSCCSDLTAVSYAQSGSLSMSPPSPSLILGESSTPPDIWFEKRFMQFPMVLADVAIKNGIFYWEVEVSSSHFYNIGVCTKGMSSSCNLREELQSWYLQRLGGTFSVFYDGYTEQLDSMPQHVNKIGVCINYTGGTLSFYNVAAQEHLCTIPTRFLQYVNPAFSLKEGSLSILCGLPVPNFVFSVKANVCSDKVTENSWHKDLAFSAVASFIQKFEDLTVTDSDSGLISSNYGSCSTLNSWSGASSADHSGLSVHIVDD